MTNSADVETVAESGADAVGFIFVPSSPRIVSRNQVYEILSTFPSGLESYGVVTNEKTSFLKELMRVCPLDGLQFHGEETPEEVLEMKEAGRKLIKVIRVKNADSLKVIPQYKGVDAILLDTYQPDKAGGTGKSFDWNLAAEAKSFGIPIILSGGLTPDNVGAAVDQAQPDGVDVSSGVEVSPGWKDHDLIRAFIRSAKRPAAA